MDSIIRKNSVLLITGCGGMLGEAIYHRFRGKCTIYAADIDINEPWLGVNILMYHRSSKLRTILKK